MDNGIPFVDCRTQQKPRCSSIKTLPCQHNYAILHYLKKSPNVWYAFLGFCRPIKGICGLTREIIVGLVANLETRQQRREEYTERDLPPEHPRASSTDDVEGIIALFHEVIGVVFDTKEFYDEFPKIMNEFSKKSDPNLPFYYYWTGSQTRYRDFPLPSFNKPSKEGVERLDKVTLSRRGDPGVFVADRASLPQKNQLTVRANFHRAPVPLPPVEFDLPL